MSPATGLKTDHWWQLFARVMETVEPYKATITIELTAPNREAAPAVFAMALEAIGMGATNAEGLGREANTYYRVTVEVNQKGEPVTAEEYLRSQLPPNDRRS